MVEIDTGFLIMVLILVAYFVFFIIYDKFQKYPPLSEYEKKFFDNLEKHRNTKRKTRRNNDGKCSVCEDLGGITAQTFTYDNDACYNCGKP